MDKDLLDQELRDEFDKCWSYVFKFFKEDILKTTYWFSIPNPMLGNIRPIDLLIRRPGKLWKFVETSKEGY